MGNSQGTSRSSIASVDGAILAEAHGIVTDMLTDSQLPPHITSGLRALASLLSPPSLASSPRTKPAGISIALVDFNNSGSDSEENPYIGERTSNIPKRGKRNLPPSFLRRMSTSTWTTTTSATGMPTLEPEPSRKRSTSFRNLQSPVSINAPSLPSPVAMPLKGRSYSTTALPIGTLAALQHSRERQDKHFLYSVTISDNTYNNRRQQLEADRESEADNENTEDEANDSIRLKNTILNTQQKQFYPRLNLTSDYDSSNDSPSGSDATLDDSTSIDTNSRFISSKKSAANEKSIAIKDDDNYRINKCILCGNQTKTNVLTDKSPVLQQNWPFCEPPPPVIPQLDIQGRYIVSGMLYDLDELATDPLLCRIHEWDYPIFDLMSKTGDAILSKMTYHVFLEAGLLEAFKIPIPEFLNYFRALEKGYRNKPCMYPSFPSH
ncbi:unnamed protein product [Medioppia subpectinata]|uniref:PDEase domain-containing protein n=1 Tax=Medioppia subpectinata TaxID=1979941 RepID=A0A7R9PXK4_9ACAR|nr:unnamed protein product [Medioppia subpectinata]CAG2104895.1 unnamed protein product [Medioppia subpectinata]